MAARIATAFGRRRRRSSGIAINVASYPSSSASCRSVLSHRWSF